MNLNRRKAALLLAAAAVQLETAAAATVLTRKLKKRRPRMYGVDLMLQHRRTNGAYYTDYLFVRKNNHDKYMKDNYRMTFATFDKLLELVGPKMPDRKYTRRLYRQGLATPHHPSVQFFYAHYIAK